VRRTVSSGRLHEDHVLQTVAADHHGRTVDETSSLNRQYYYCYCLLLFVVVVVVVMILWSHRYKVRYNSNYYMSNKI
jgi:hypothetical protein